MTKYQRALCRTVIIQPGSTFLRIGVASDEEPKLFLHCIARESRDAFSVTTPALISASPVTTLETKLDVTAFSHFGSSVHPDSFVIENKLYKILNSDITGSEHLSSFHKRSFIPFLSGLQRGFDCGYQLYWPIVSGQFNKLYSTSLNLRNLEDMWVYALEKHLNISRETFHLYSVILVIEDIFIRREVRQMVNMLLLDLRFSRVVVQQASVCATYGVGLPSACVIDFGFQKTSISCVDEGISLADVRVKLPIGVKNCFQALRTTLEIHGQDKPDLLDILKGTKNGSFEDMRFLFNAMFDADSAIITRMKDQPLEAVSSVEINIELASGREVVLPLTALLTAHLAPYFPKSRGLLPDYQIPAIDAPEPDDPFDEVYCAMTVREKRRKLHGDLVTGRSDEGVFEIRSQKVSKVSSFDDLAEAVAWSIRQAAVAAASASALDSESLGLDGATDPKGDQLRQRLFGCILLVGGGAIGLGGFLLSKWLTHELHSLVGDDMTVEVLLRPQGVSNLAWQGARLMLNTDCISDLWLTPTEWQRYGSRLLREKAPFPW